VPLEGEELEKEVWQRLKTCYDPEIPVNIVDLGLIYSMEISPVEQGKRIDIRPLAAPALIVSITRLEADPALTVGSSVAAGRNRLGEVLDDLHRHSGFERGSANTGAVASPSKMSTRSPNPAAAIRVPAISESSGSRRQTVCRIQTLGSQELPEPES